MLRSLIVAAISAILFFSCVPADDPAIDVMSLNIRLDTQHDGPNAWPHRAGMVAGFVNDQIPDLLGMQEVLWHQYLYLDSALIGYGSVAAGRDDGLREGEACPVFYRLGRFDRLDRGSFWLSATPDVPGSVGWGAALTRVATWVRLYDKVRQDTLLFINTHFDHVGEEARRQSALLIIRKIKEIVGERPAVVTGDFNVTDASDAYETITTNEFVMKDAYKTAARVTGVDYTFHDFARIPAEDCEKIDFIFVTPQVLVKSCEIPAEVPEALLSDHNPQLADLEF